MRVDNNTLCYEGIQRVYRNAIVKTIRQRLTQRYGADALTRLKRPFAREWDEIHASAKERRLSGQLTAELADEFDLLGVNHFFNLLDAEYGALLPEDGLLDEQQRQQNKQALLAWTKTIKSLRDPLSHPAEEAFPYADAYSLLDAARRVLERLGASSDALRVCQLRDRLEGAPYRAKVNEPLEVFLPPRESVVVDFIGRASEMEVLWRWFDDPLSRRWALAGEGGKGKSAIAYSFGVEVAERGPEPYQIVLWLSAKHRRFVEGTTRPVGHADFFDLSSALDHILSRLGWSEAVELGLDSKRGQVLEVLDNFPALVIVDDIDSLEGADEAALEFFTFNLPATKSKVLLTSRRVVFGMGGSTTTVAGFGDSDAKRFIASKIEQMGLSGARLTDSDIWDICKVTDGSPLYIEDLLRLLAIVPAKEAIATWRGKKGDEARAYALGRELDLLSPRAKEVLVAACTADESWISLPEIQAVTGMSGDALESGLGELQKLYLIPKPQLVADDYRFAVNTNTRRLVVSELTSTELMRRVREARRSLDGKIPPSMREKLSPVISQAVLYVRTKRYVEAEALLKSALEKHPNNPTLLGHLAWVYKAWEPRRVTDARERFQRAEQLKNGDPEMFIHWSRLEADQGEWPAAIRASEAGLACAGQHENLKLLQHAGYAHSRLGRELLGSLNRGRGLEELQKAVTYLERVVRARASRFELKVRAQAYRSLIRTLEDLGDLVRARQYAREWLLEMPGDELAKSENERFARRYGEDPATLA
jgi:tetratricopeptide (TPR) repeat protein